MLCAYHKRNVTYAIGTIKAGNWMHASMSCENLSGWDQWKIFMEFTIWNIRGINDKEELAWCSG